MIRDQTQPISSRRLMTFTIAIVAVVVTCNVILPSLARVPNVRQRAQWLQDHGIDPTAMYYTELPVMETILEQTRAREFQASVSVP